MAVMTKSNVNAKPLPVEGEFLKPARVKRQLIETLTRAIALVEAGEIISPDSIGFIAKALDSITACNEITPDEDERGDQQQQAQDLFLQGLAGDISSRKLDRALRTNIKVLDERGEKFWAGLRADHAKREAAKVGAY